MVFFEFDITHVGSASIQALASDAFKTKVNVKAGVRDPEAEKAQSLKAGDNITLVKADMSEPATMEAAFAGADAVFGMRSSLPLEHHLAHVHLLVITPGHAERTQLTINGIEAAKKAGVPFVLVVSVPTTGTDSIFGRQSPSQCLPCMQLTCSQDRLDPSRSTSRRVALHTPSSACPSSLTTCGALKVRALVSYSRIDVHSLC